MTSKDKQHTKVVPCKPLPHASALVELVSAGVILIDSAKSDLAGAAPRLIHARRALPLTPTAKPKKAKRHGKKLSESSKR